MPATSKKQYIPVLLTVFLDMAAFSFLIPLIGIYGRHYGASGLTLSLLGCTYSVFQFLCAPLWGKLSDTYGRRSILLITIAGSIPAFLAFAFADGLVLLFLSRALSGVFAGNISVAQAYIADVTDRDSRAAGMGLIGAVIGLGFVMGPPLGGISAYYISLQAPGAIAAALCVLNLIVAFRWLEEPKAHADRMRKTGVASVIQGLRSQGIALREHQAFYAYCMLVFVSTFAFCHMEHPFSLFIQEQFALPTSRAGFETGLILMFIGVIGVIIQGGLIRKLTAVYTEESLLITGFISLTIALLLIPNCSSWSALYGAAVFIGVGSALANPCLQSLLSKSVDDSVQGTALGFAQGMSSLARALGPFSGLWLFEVSRFLPFYLAALLYGVLIIAGLLLYRHTRSIRSVQV